ncbi:MAG: trypsin-like peptidase domain-containing protein [Treponema sp.]|jgi:S1-C subfamily serine protease|nr:trypsin-like peptidase domain-containing protein [Treponema sp.]
MSQSLISENKLSQGHIKPAVCGTKDFYIFLCVLRELCVSVRGFFKRCSALYFIFVVLLASCHTQTRAEKKLTPPKSIKDFRLDDISKQVKEDPARAIHLIEVYEILYGPGSVYPDGANPDVRTRLASLREEASEGLRASQVKALEEKRWADAASLARSLSHLGINVESTGEEPDIVLEYAKEQLSDNKNLEAFLAAVRAHSLKPLTFDDALLFLNKAVNVKQRRTAAFFLDIINRMEGNRIIPTELSSFAQGRDTITDMVKGVATVWVDRGVRIEKGRGFPDRAIGSAFFVDSSGFLITNHHVIASEVDPTYKGFSRLYIRMGDSTSPLIPARVIGWDSAMDLALIKTELTPEYVFSVVDWIIPNAGDTVYAIGSPVGLEKTVTQGIVSALGRRLVQIGDVIQIDAAVNPGNSGGPVLDTSGRLVGIVYAGAERYQGLNFAVPAERLAAALPAMISGGKAERPWLGLSLSESSAGAEIVYVAPSTPAAEQQIKEGSLIKTINGEAVKAVQGGLIPALQDKIFPLRPGELVTLELADPEGAVQKHMLRLVSRPVVPMADAAQKDSKERLTAPLFGLVLAPQAGSSLFSRYAVKKVIRGSVADVAGLSESDPVSIRGFKVFEKDGYALLDIDVKKRRMGYLETSMRLPALLDTPDTL